MELTPLPVMLFLFLVLISLMRVAHAQVMASSSSLLSEDQLQCSICLDMFTDPVSTPCGHNFCMICLKQCWDTSPQCQCPVCKANFPKRPELCVNTFISGLAAHFKESVQVKFSSAADKLPFKTKKSQLGEIPTEVRQKIQERIKKIEEIKHSLKLNKKTTEKEIADIMGVFSSLKLCIERSQAELLKGMEEKQKAAERQAEEFIKELEQEITELKRRNTELEQLSHTEDHLHLLQTEITVNARLSVETLRRALSQLQETLSEKMKKLPEIILMRIQKYAVDVTLDPDTVHPELVLSDDAKQVRHQGISQKLPDNPERFDRCPSVLGKEGFSSGRFYYEVYVRGNAEWDLGVAQESVNRKGRIVASPKNGYLTIWLRNKTEYKALDSPRIPLPLKQAPQKVGVFVDYEEGLVSFYDVEAKSHIYSFTGQTFTKKLYPYFCPSLNFEGKSSKSLIITPVQQSKSNPFPSEAIFTM